MRYPKVRLIAAAVVVVVSLGAVSARAEKKGDSVWDLGLGAGVPLSGLNLTRFGGGSESPGGAGFALSPQYLYQTSSSLGLGAELTYMNFPSAGVTLPGGPASANGNLIGLEAITRYLFNPDAAFSPYLTGGVGFARLAVTVQQGPTTVLDTSSTGLTAFPGAGLKADLGQDFEAECELRWQMGSVSRSDFGTGIYNALALFLRLGWH